MGLFTKSERRVFDSRPYKAVFDTLSKYDAKQRAKYYRGQGHLARVTRRTLKDGRGKPYKAWTVWRG